MIYSLTMSQEIVLTLLKELGSPSNIDQILSFAIEKKIEKARDRVKIRDSLILLSRKGLVKETNGTWKVTSKGREKVISRA